MSSNVRVLLEDRLGRLPIRSDRARHAVWRRSSGCARRSRRHWSANRDRACANSSSRRIFRAIVSPSMCSITNPWEPSSSGPNVQSTGGTGTPASARGAAARPPPPGRLRAERSVDRAVRRAASVASERPRLARSAAGEALEVADDDVATESSRAELGELDHATRRSCSSAYVAQSYRWEGARFEDPAGTAGRVHARARECRDVQRVDVLQRLRPEGRPRRLVPARQPRERGLRGDDVLPVPARRHRRVHVRAAAHREQRRVRRRRDALRGRRAVRGAARSPTKARSRCSPIRTR